MEKVRTRHIIILGISLSFVAYCIYAYYTKLSWANMQRLQAVASCIKLYIEEHEGHFPTSQEDLIAKGFIKIETYGNLRHKYRVRFSVTDVFHNQDSNKAPAVKMEGWMPISSFNEFNIRYGTRIEDIQVSGHRLYDKNTQAQILLVEGSYKRGLRQEHESISFELYKEMLRLQREHRSINEED